MTSGLLNTFSNGESIKISGENFDPEEIDIALSRLGDKITDETKSIILSKIHQGVLHEDKYLDYLVSSILENYRTLADIDSRINDRPKSKYPNKSRHTLSSRHKIRQCPGRPFCQHQ